MKKQRGRKSVASKSVQLISSNERQPAPAGLDAVAAALWDDILIGYAADHFNPADLVLLREFCHTSAVLLPKANSDLERFPGQDGLTKRTTLIKEVANIATKLRLCVSARTRGDLASTRDASKPQSKSASKLWERP